MSKINIIKPWARVLPSSTDPIDKVAEMARICYRSEQAASRESDSKLIRGCVSRGHTSVIEHGHMSVYLGTDKIDLSIMNNPSLPTGFTLPQVWSQFRSSEINKYIEVYSDEQIYKQVDGSNAVARVYPVLVGDFRAWLNILDDCMAASIQDGFVVGIAFIGCIINQAATQFPDIFGELRDKVNEAFGAANKDHYLRKTFLPEDSKDDDKLTIDHLSKFYKHFKVVVSRASPKYSFSAIIRTDRSVTHELVRHRRDVAYSQESQRYVNYNNRGYEVIWPLVDPKKYNGKFANGLTGETDLELLPGGYIPQESNTFAFWKKAMLSSIDQYESILQTCAYCEDEEGNTVERSMLPEVARFVLPNSFATTIGVTWTPATFVNLLRWRLDEHAQWPIRSMIGTIVIEGLRTHHDFFENFPPKLIIHWIELCVKHGILEDTKLEEELVAYQNKRQENLDKAAEELKQRFIAQREAQAAKMKEAAKAAEQQVATPAKEDNAPAAEATPSVEK